MSCEPFVALKLYTDIYFVIGLSKYWGMHVPLPPVPRTIVIMVIAMVVLLKSM